jgi:hypothetical protein
METFHINFKGKQIEVLADYSVDDNQVMYDEFPTVTLNKVQYQNNNILEELTDFEKEYLVEQIADCLSED